jgi:hypothetical protein
MPQFGKAAIEGMRRCFVPYVLLEEERWPEVERAERLTPEGDAAWEKLVEECRGRFFGQYEPERDLDPGLEQVSLS